MRDVAIVGFTQTKHRRRVDERNEVEMLMPVIGELFEDLGVTIGDIGFTVSGSTDYLAGQGFSFVMTLDAVGPFPPISESHVEMDGAWAMAEAWTKIQTGTVDTALVYAYGKSSPGSLRDVLTRQLDPYYVAPLWPDAISLAALQARAMLEAGLTTEAELAEIAVRNRRSALDNPFAQLALDGDVDALLAAPTLVSPLRRHDCPPITDGACAMVLAAGDRARELCDRPAWIRGLDHRVEAHTLGVRDLTDSVSTRLAAQGAGALGGRYDFAELHAPFTHQEVLVRSALELGSDVAINPSGGALAANPVMATGLVRMGEAATRISRGEGDRALAHATQGPLLQQNLVCVLEGE